VFGYLPKSGKEGCSAAIINADDCVDDFFHPDMPPFMVEQLKKLQLLQKFVWRVLGQLFSELWAYYASPYPFLLIIGVFRRILRRAKTLWLPKGPGRPPVREDLVDLILDMKGSNWSWGALRISQELLLLGMHIHKKTVKRILIENGMVPPKTRITPPTWMAFLKAHKHLWALDFTCVFDVQGLQVFILAVVDLQTRQLVAINATLHPDRNWIIQQICNAEMSGYQLPLGLIADNDGIFGKWLEHAFQRYFDMAVGRSPPGQPWCNGISERFHRSLKSEVLNRVGHLDVAGIRRLSICYQEYFNCRRPHQGINGKTPTQVTRLTDRQMLNNEIRYAKTVEVDGIITSFKLVA
jgi:putative transposase